MKSPREKLVIPGAVSDAVHFAGLETRSGIRRKRAKSDGTV
jgi:hypothetical protein